MNVAITFYLDFPCSSPQEDPPLKPGQEIHYCHDKESHLDKEVCKQGWRGECVLCIVVGVRS